MPRLHDVERFLVDGVILIAGTESGKTAILHALKATVIAARIDRSRLTRH